MCGICGKYNYKSFAPVEELALHTMNQVLYHRGPDDEGYYLNENIGFAIRRLSIIDLNRGHQPIHNENETIWIVFNGEIYNYLELRHHLEAKGHRFYTQSDTETIVHAYEEWGLNCALYLNGIFGFSLWDNNLKRLFLARDQYGVKPLYYYDDGQCLVFASEVKAILQDDQIHNQVDQSSLDLFLTFGFVPSPYTMFNGINKLPPGYSVVVEKGEAILSRYWSPQPRINRNIKEGEIIEQLQDCLYQAVKRQMISDVPLGALLSGGIDSSVIVAILSELLGKPVKTFTVGFKDGEKVNELDEARQTARLFGTEHHEVIIDHLDYEDLLNKITWHMDEPVSTTSALAMYSVCKLARENVTVVLTGQGADEPFAGYYRYLGERYGSIYRMVPKGVRHAIILPIINRMRRGERYKRAVRSLDICQPDERFMDIYAVFTEKQKSIINKGRHSTNGVGAYDIVHQWRQGVDYLDSLSQMTFVDARLSLADDLLLYGDKMSMAASVEARVPFLDLELMNIAEALPAQLRIKGTTRKYIHKKVVSKWLPAKIIQRPKKGFETPVDRWFRREMKGYVTDMLLGKDAAASNYFEKDVINNMIKTHAEGREDYQRQLFSLLTFEIWHRLFIDHRVKIERV